MFDDSPLNHPRGSGLLDTYATPVTVELSDEGVLHLQTAQIHCGLFEVPYAEVIETLPPSLHPSNPGYAGLTFFRVEESDIGPFEYAVFGIACRNVIRPRMMTLSAFASTDQAAAYLKRRWGFPCQVAKVHTRGQYDAVVSEIVLDGRVVAHMESLSPETLLGASKAVRYPQALNSAQIGGKAGLLQSDAIYEYHESYRGRLKLQVFDVDAMAAGRVHPTDMIAGTYAKASIEMLPAKNFLDLRELGGVTKLKSGAPELA